MLILRVSLCKRLIRINPPVKNVRLFQPLCLLFKHIKTYSTKRRTNKERFKQVVKKKRKKNSNKQAKLL